jgi:hypothetical protein
MIVVPRTARQPTVLFVVALFKGTFGGSVPAFSILIVITMFFVDGGLAIASPYSAGAFPVELLGRGTGLVQACHGIGKILARWC